MVFPACVGARSRASGFVIRENLAQYGIAFVDGVRSKEDALELAMHLRPDVLMEVDLHRK